MAEISGEFEIKVRKLNFIERILVRLLGFDRANAILKRFNRALI